MPVKTGLAGALGGWLGGWGYSADTPKAGLGQVGPSSNATEQAVQDTLYQQGLNWNQLQQQSRYTNTVNQTEMTTDNQLALAEFQYQVALGNLNRIRAALGRATEQSVETIETDSVERRVEIECL